MPATQTVFLKHTFLNKAAQARPYTAHAHSRYIARRSATQYHHVENMPLSYRDRQQWYHDMEKGLRKNGRVIDKFTVSIPKEVSLEDAASVITRLGRELGEGRAPFEFSLQGWGSNNHHSHIIYCDRGEDGKRIFGTTDRNSTREIKLEWERVANEAFEELGYDVRVQVKEGWQEQPEVEAPEEVDVVELKPLSTDTPVDPEPESVEAEGDFDGDPDVEKLTAEERVRAAKESWENYSYIQRGIEERDEVVCKYEVYRERAERAALDAAEGISVKAIHEQWRDRARERYAETHKPNGKAKGVKLALFGRTLWQSSKSVAAEHSEHQLRTTERSYENAVRDLEELNNTSERLSTQATELKVKAEALERHVRVLGSDAELAQASKEYLDRINQYVGEMSLEELVVMVEEGEIDPDECADILRVTGRKHDLEEFLEAEGRREEQQEDGGESL